MKGTQYVICLTIRKIILWCHFAVNFWKFEWLFVLLALYPYQYKKLEVVKQIFRRNCNIPASCRKALLTSKVPHVMDIKLKSIPHNKIQMNLNIPIVSQYQMTFTFWLNDILYSPWDICTTAQLTYFSCIKVNNQSTSNTYCIHIVDLVAMNVW